MSDELYESLIEIYKSFILEKENILKKLELNNNDNEYQLYNKYLYINSYQQIYQLLKWQY